MYAPNKIKLYGDRDHAPDSIKLMNYKLYNDHFYLNYSHSLAYFLAHSKWPSTYLINFYCIIIDLAFSFRFKLFSNFKWVCPA